MFPSFEVPNLDNLKFSPELTVDPDITVANLETYYNELNSSWDIGEQCATLTGDIVSRTFSELEFNINAESLELVELGYHSEEYEGSTYYRVIHKFIENEYYSSISEEHANFLKWEYSKNIYLQEIIYKNSLINFIKWERPFTIIENQNNGDTVSIIPLPRVTPNSTRTGTGLAKTIFINNEPTLIQYNSLSIPFIKTIFVGKALGAKVYCDSSIQVKLKSSLEDSGIIVENTGVILLTKPYLEIKINNPTEYLPTFIKVEFYGVELWRSYSPITIDEEPDILIHSTGDNKYKPPGKEYLPDHFWNSNPNLNSFESFSSRNGAASTWLS